MSKRYLFIIGFFLLIGYYIYRKSKAIVGAAIQAQGPTDVMSDDPDLH